MGRYIAKTDFGGKIGYYRSPGIYLFNCIHGTAGRGECQGEGKLSVISLQFGKGGRDVCSSLSTVLDNIPVSIADSGTYWSLQYRIYSSQVCYLCAFTNPNDNRVR